MLDVVVLSSLSVLGRVPPLHLLVMAAIFLPGQSLTRTLQLDCLLTLDPGAAGSVHLYSSVFGTVTRPGLTSHQTDNISKFYQHKVPCKDLITPT